MKLTTLGWVFLVLAILVAFFGDAKVAVALAAIALILCFGMDRALRITGAEK